MSYSFPVDDDYQTALTHHWDGAVAFSGGVNDAAHDIAHIRRVLRDALAIAAAEGGDTEILRAAVWFHDLVNLPKDHPERHMASRMSAAKASVILREWHVPEDMIAQISHAIAAHSFSANIPPETIEARILQDADRLDAIGAIGIARAFSVGGQLGRPLFNADDPFAEQRALDDTRYSLDHFYVKLLRLPSMMQTDTGRALAQARVDFMNLYLENLRGEIAV